ncbi:unnamed protein product [Schistosoma mattheei]|uniref:Uncharacterized protein n=1 Tax=Schistosoma mattheei TaxID=31246 RepID=A0A183P7J6_9TREM|nr:unnamed protein product [Schistosoma mattheei]
MRAVTTSRSPTPWKGSYADLREAFILFDVNRDGRITETELESVLGFLGVKTTRDEVRRMIQDADCDGM